MALELRGVTKSYAAPVLRGVDLHVAQGESVALVGANGAGKSTLIKIALGLVKARTGEGTLWGFPFGDVRGLKRTGYLPEMPSFWPELSARDLLRALGGLRGLEGGLLEERIDRLLSALGLAKRGSRPLAGYSKGMLQRTGVAQMLLHEPDLLILDEPMSGLDPRAQEKLRQILIGLREKGKSLLVSSHSLEDIRLLCDRIVVLEKGEIVLAGPVASALDELVKKYRSTEPWDEDPMEDSVVADL